MTGFYRGAKLITRGPQGNGGYNSYRDTATERRNNSYSAIRNFRHNDNSNNCESGDFSQYDSRLKNRNYESYRQTPSYRDNRRYSNDANSNRGDPSSNRGHVSNTDNRKNVKEHRNGRHYDDFDDRTYSQVVREVPSSNKPQSAQPLQTAGDKPPPPPCKSISSSSADAQTGATSSPVPSMLTRWGDTTGTTTQPARTAVEALPRFHAPGVTACVHTPEHTANTLTAQLHSRRRMHQLHVLPAATTWARLNPEWDEQVHLTQKQRTVTWTHKMTGTVWTRMKLLLMRSNRTRLWNMNAL
ncbi:hypothetical protein ACOMHN_050963 [Nucella lapillus]